MTCLNTLQLLEDYADNELSPEKTIEIKKHLDECLSCQNEYSIIRNLKELVQQKPVYNPGEEYWSETSNIILARTVELSDSKYAFLSPTEKKVLKRNNFYRALVSVFASLIILFSAILIGSTQNKNLSRFENQQAPVYTLFPMENLVDSDNTIIITRNELFNQAKGSLLLGSPGFLGRFSPFIDFNKLIDKL